MAAEILILVVLPALLTLAAGWDLASFTIPNRLSLGLLAVFLLFAFVVGMPLSVLGSHALAGLCALTLGFALFALGYIGGGDAKLFAAVCLWFGLGDLLPYAMIASILGGALTLGILMMRAVPLPRILARQDWILRLHDERAGVPYGVALAAGAILLLPHAEIFRAAARV